MKPVLAGLPGFMLLQLLPRYLYINTILKNQYVFLKNKYLLLPYPGDPGALCMFWNGKQVSGSFGNSNAAKIFAALLKNKTDC